MSVRLAKKKVRLENQCLFGSEKESAPEKSVSVRLAKKKVRLGNWCLFV